MALIEMPNGEVVEVDDNVTPEGLAAIKKQYMPKPQTRAEKRASGTPRKGAAPSDPLHSGGLYSIPVVGDALNWLNDATRASKQGVTAGFSDELEGVGGALTGQGYTATRDAARAKDVEARARSPITTTAAELGSSLAVPIGNPSGMGFLRGAEAVAGGAGSNRVANAFGRAATALEGAPGIAQAVAVGAGQGALNAAGNASELSDVPAALQNGALFGGAAGGALGGAMHLGQKGIQMFTRGRGQNAERDAYERIADMLKRGDGESTYTPAEAQRAIQAGNEAGGDIRVADLTPSLQSQAGALARKSDLDGSVALRNMGLTRRDERAAKFGEDVRRTADLPESDRFAREAELAANRKAAGQEGYAEGGILDAPINPTPKLQSYLKDAPEEVQAALRGAYREMDLRDMNPAQVVGPDGMFTHIPNLRTFDYVKRAFDTQIGAALRAGDKGTAQGLSYQLDKLKGALAEANPNNAEYTQLLASMRDEFQKQNALDIGTNVMSRIQRDPRKVLRDLQDLPSHAKMDARIGIIDALINTDNKADPYTFFSSIMRNDAQKKVLEFAFGGRGNLGRFERSVRRELRSAQTDAKAAGPQSATFEFLSADNATGLPTGKDIMAGGLKGLGFGGITGAAANVVSTLNRIATGTSRATQEEIAKILLSRGENLVKGTEQALTYKLRREAANKARVRAAAKIGQQAATTNVGG